MNNDPETKSFERAEHRSDERLRSIAVGIVFGMIGAMLGAAIVDVLFFYMIVPWIEPSRPLGGGHGVMDPAAFFAAIVFPAVVAFGAILGAIAAIFLTLLFRSTVGNKESCDDCNHSS